MSKPIVSVVMASFNRAHLLARSLIAYENQGYRMGEMELVVIDDHSTDNTGELVRTWSNRTGIPATVLTPSPKLRAWRDCGAVLNHGIRASRGRYVIMTHPEVMPGTDSVRFCVDTLSNADELDQGAFRLKYGVYVSCKVYYLDRQNQLDIDTVRWATYGNLELRKLPGFYDGKQGDEADDYSHRTTDLVATPGARIRSWESWVFGGMSRRTLNLLGGMLETQEWGSVDVAFMNRRNLLRIPNATGSDPATIVAHQNHDGPLDVSTPRVEQVWMKELRGITFNEEQMVYPAIDNL